MNLEGLTLKLVTDNLIKQLEGGKIYKIFMPTPNSLLLMVRRDRDTIAPKADLTASLLWRLIYLEQAVRLLLRS